MKTESQTCLQYAMWTLAASLASHLQDVRESLYECTSNLLQALESREEEFLNIQHVQARLLICVYELMRQNHHRGWMSAGRLFRLVQLMHLHEIDSPENASRRRSAPGEEDWILTEEKRRAFWMSYTLDLFLSVRGKWPLTLHEHTVSFCDVLAMWLQAKNSGHRLQRVSRLRKTIFRTEPMCQCRTSPTRVSVLIRANARRSQSPSSWRQSADTLLHTDNGRRRMGFRASHLRSFGIATTGSKS